MEEEVLLTALKNLATDLRKFGVPSCLGTVQERTDGRPTLDKEHLRGRRNSHQR